MDSLPNPPKRPPQPKGESIIASTDVLGTIHLGHFTLLTNSIDIGKKFHELL
jgi:hypothetical protein